MKSYRYLVNSRMPRHSCCEVRVMQLHDILLLRTSAILPEAISAGGLTPTTDTSLFLTTYRGKSHLPADITLVFDKCFYVLSCNQAPITLHKYKQHDQRQDKCQVKPDGFMCREFHSGSGICFFYEIIPSPAISCHTEQKIYQ